MNGRESKDAGSLQDKEGVFMKKLLAVLVFLGLLSLVAACGGSSTSSGSASSTPTTSGGGNVTVHLGNMTFLQSSITISKGSSITLANDSAALHIIANGSWVNGSPQPMQESGAPVANNVQVSGNGSAVIGPFNTPGTYHFYCTVHPAMNLTVIVQ
jgi:plastocyanin